MLLDIILTGVFAIAVVYAHVFIKNISAHEQGGTIEDKKLL